MPAAADIARDLEHKELLRFTTAGSVDDGKSTLIGRLLYETKCVYLDQLGEAKHSTKNVSVRDAGEEIDFALLTDGLKAEREQGITIDVAYRYFATPRRKFVIADTPGHEQYTRNMATGASTAQLALILVDARNGVLPQSKRHAFISALLGIKHVVVCVNKMDLVDYAEAVFEEIRQEFEDFAARLNIADLRFVPISALKGDNVVLRSERTGWYSGPSVLELLETIHIGSDRNLIDMRFPVQRVVRPTLDFRGYAGTVAAGIVRPGDEVTVLPSRKTSKVAQIVTWDGDRPEAFPPQAVTITLEDELDVSRGDMLVPVHNQPHVARRLEAMLVWMGEEPMKVGGDYEVKHTTQLVRGRVEALRYQTDVNTLSRRIDSTTLALNEIGRVVLSTHRPLFFDPYRKNRLTGGLILIDPLTNATVAAGMIIDREPTDALPEQVAEWHDQDEGRSSPTGEAWVSPEQKAALLGQRPATIWLTGRPASGGTEVACALERLLFERGRPAHVLDGSEVRRTLNPDLDHAPADVSEHLRRVSAVASMFNDAGLFAICSFGSPTRAVRAKARELIGPERFVEVHVAPPLAWCEARDEKRVYARARSGELRNVAGVNAPYEAPEGPDLVLRPDERDFTACAEQVVAFLEAEGRLGPGPGK